MLDEAFQAESIIKSGQLEAKVRFQPLSIGGEESALVPSAGCRKRPKLQCVLLDWESMLA